MQRAQLLKANVWPAHVKQKMEQELLLVMEAKAALHSSGWTTQMQLSPEMQKVDDLLKQQSLEQLALDCGVPAVPTTDLLGLDMATGIQNESDEKLQHQ